MNARKMLSALTLGLAILYFGLEVATLIMGVPSRIGSIFYLLMGAAFSWLIIDPSIYHRLASRVSLPPGWGLRRFAEFCFSKKTFTQVLEPALSDMQKEHFEALAAGRPWKARMVLVRGYWSFWSAVVAQLPISFARRVYEVWKATKTGT